jgi:hypothetical protein
MLMDVMENAEAQLKMIAKAAVGVEAEANAAAATERDAKAGFEAEVTAPHAPKLHYYSCASDPAASLKCSIFAQVHWPARALQG